MKRSDMSRVLPSPPWRGANPRQGLTAVLVLLCLLFTPLTGAVNGQVVHLKGSANTVFNQRFSKLLEARLGNDTELRTHSLQTPTGGLAEPVLALGPEAFANMRQQSPGTRTLALLVGKSFIDGFLDDNGARDSAVYYDAPLLRQALVGKAIMPQATRIAILASPGEASRHSQLVEELKRYGLEAQVFLVSGEDSIIAALDRSLRFGDFLLATPDERIYNPRTIKHILLTTYRRNRLVIGPGHSFVKAGALASSYTPLEEYADYAARYVEHYLSTGEFPEPVYPDAFAVEVNRQVARSLNIPVPDSAVIVQRVRELMAQAPEVPE